MSLWIHSDFIWPLSAHTTESRPFPNAHPKFQNIFPPYNTLNQWVNTSMSVGMYMNLQSDWWVAHQMLSRNANPEFRVFTIFLTDEIVMTKRRVHCSNCKRNLLEFVKLCIWWVVQEFGEFLVKSVEYGVKSEIF